MIDYGSETDVSEEGRTAMATGFAAARAGGITTAQDLLAAGSAGG